MYSKNNRILWFCFSVFFALSSFSFAAPGQLDKTFGTGGLIITGYSSKSNILGFDLVIQSSGKIVVAGQYFDAAGDRIALARFSSAGVLDTTFGTGGWKIINFGYASIFAVAVAQQSDGKIVVAGTLLKGNTHMFVARFTANGQVDSTFGTGGLALIDFGSNSEGTDLAVQADGKIVVVGSAVNGGNFAVARLDKIGKLDTTFGSVGRVRTDFTGSAANAFSVAIQTDQKIVAGGITHGAAANHAFTVVRYKTNGGLDLTFSTDGKVRTDFGPKDDFGNAILIQPDGKIVLGGFPQPVSGVFGFVRYNTTGTVQLQRTQNYAGTDSDYAYGMAIATNGRIILGGRVSNGNVTSSFALSCYNGTTGALVTTFGTSGWNITNVGPDSENISNLKLQYDQKIVAAGFSKQGDGRYYLVVARYTACS